jgi:hypothetical protein
MIDLMKAVKDAVVLKLKVGRPGEFGPVLTHVPEGTKPPFTFVGTMSTTPQSRRDQVEMIKFAVEHIYRGADPDQLHAALHFNRGALDRQPLASDVAAIEAPDLLEAGCDLQPAADGVTHAGYADFQTYAEPAA